MTILQPSYYPANSKLSSFNPCLPFSYPIIHYSVVLATIPEPQSEFRKYLNISFKLRKFERYYVPSCSKNRLFEDFGVTPAPKIHGNEEIEELELLVKPFAKPVSDTEEDEKNDSKKPDKDEVLEPFLKFFKPLEEENDSEEISVGDVNEKVSVEYYEPKAGDLVMGVVVSGNENKLDVNVGADLLGLMLTKEILPLYDKEMDYLLCDVNKDAEEFFVRGKLGILRNDEALSRGSIPGRPVVDLGTVLFAEVLGRTLGGRPLLSTRRVTRRIAWHRVRQIKQLNEPIEVKITEWNNGGLLTRIEGLRAFLPKAELINRVNNFTALKENVGRRIYVQITRMNEDTNDLIISEKEAWEMMHVQEGTLLKGTVRKVFPYGAQIRIGDSNRSGLLHISNITRGRVVSINDLLAVDEEVKVIVVKSMFPDKISLSIAELESEPGLFLSNKERVFSEAEEMAKKYRQKISVVSPIRKLESLPMNGLPFGDVEILYANWKWFKFERDEFVTSEIHTERELLLKETLKRPFIQTSST